MHNKCFKDLDRKDRVPSWKWLTDSDLKAARKL